MRYLRYVREQKGLTQDELSALSGIPQAGISKVERGIRKPHPGTLEKLAKVLGVEEPAMLALNMTSVETFDQLVNGSSAIRRAYLEHKRDTGWLESFIEDLEEIYGAAMSDYGSTSLAGARVQAGYMLGYFRCAMDFGVITEDVITEEQEETEDQERVLTTSS
jgi:transcriptional regulator with XRE-family HTH domain